MIRCLLPFLFGRRGEKDAWYIYFTRRLPVVQNLDFCLIGRSPASIGQATYLPHPVLSDRFFYLRLFMTETTRWSRSSSFESKLVLRRKIKSILFLMNQVNNERRKTLTAELFVTGKDTCYFFFGAFLLILGRTVVFDLWIMNTGNPACRKSKRRYVVQNLDFCLTGRKTKDPSEPCIDWSSNISGFRCY